MEIRPPPTRTKIGALACYGFAISVSHIKLSLPFDMALDELFVYSIYRFLARNKIKEIEPGSFDGLEESLIIL